MIKLHSSSGDNDSNADERFEIFDFQVGSLASSLSHSWKEYACLAQSDVKSGDWHTTFQWLPAAEVHGHLSKTIDQLRAFLAEIRSCRPDPFIDALDRKMVDAAALLARESSLTAERAATIADDIRELLVRMRLHRDAKASPTTNLNALLAFVHASHTSAVPLIAPGNPQHAGEVYCRMRRLWEHVSMIRGAALIDDRQRFESEFEAAGNLHMELYDSFHSLRVWLVDANSQLGNGRIEVLGRCFASAHECIFDIASGVIAAAVVANCPETFEAVLKGESDDRSLGSLSPLNDWPVVRDAIRRLPTFNMDDAVDVAYREAALVMKAAQHEMPGASARNAGGYIERREILQYCESNAAEDPLQSFELTPIEIVDDPSNPFARMFGTPYPLKADAAVCVKALVEAKGELVALSRLGVSSPSRTMNSLPEPLKSCFKSMGSGKGWKQIK